MKKIVVSATSILLFCIIFNVGPATGEENLEGAEKQAFFLKTGQDLVDLCSIKKDHPLHDKAVAFCYGYMTGAISFYGAIADSPKTPKIICTDRVVPRSEMVDVFLSWAAGNPGHLSEPAIDSLVRSAVAKWPCPQK